MILRAPRTLIAPSIALSAALTLAACQQSDEPADAAASAETATAESGMMESAPAAAVETDALAVVLAAQPEDVQARYVYRHPAETLEFFGIEPGMAVMEALPGGGWYTRILAPYLGAEGMLVGVDYNKTLFPLFGFMSDEDLAKKETWADDWIAKTRMELADGVADIDAFQFGSLPERVEGELDAALFIRALHNMARFQAEGDFLTEALAETYAALKPGGVVGVVQHMGPEDAPDAWADGSAGYLKKSFVIEQFEAAGFELVAESDINTNPKDTPTTDDIVWRLPPSLSGSGENPELAEQMRAIGESNRMTLLFRKPA